MSRKALVIVLTVLFVGIGVPVLGAAQAAQREITAKTIQDVKADASTKVTAIKAHTGSVVYEAREKVAVYERREAKAKREIRDIRAARAAAKAAASGVATTEGVSTAALTGDDATGPGGASGGWAALRDCESGGDYTMDSGNGFYGAYQFMQGTWEAVGGTGNPAQASPAEQDKRAAILMEQSGAGQWPVCGPRAGF